MTVSPTLVNGIVPWATVQSAGTAATGNTVAGNNFATVSGGNIVGYTGATPETNADTSVFFSAVFRPVTIQPSITI